MKKQLPEETFKALIESVVDSANGDLAKILKGSGLFFQSPKNKVPSGVVLIADGACFETRIDNILVSSTESKVEALGTLALVLVGFNIKPLKSSAKLRMII